MGRMTLAAVRKVAPTDSYRLLIHGGPGVGKSTFASDAPSPVFIAPEKAIERLGVEAFPEPTTLAEVYEAIDALQAGGHGHRTLVLDELGWLFGLVGDAVCKANGWTGLDDEKARSFGAGSTAMLQESRGLLARLERLQSRSGMSIVMLGHSALKRINDPVALAEYDQMQLDGVPPKVEGLIRAWVEGYLYARFDLVTARDASKRVRATSSGARYLYTVGCAGYVAKNRWSLPERLPLSWAEFEQAVKSGGAGAVDDVRAEIEALVEAAGSRVNGAKVRSAVQAAGKDAAKLSRIADALRGQVGTTNTQQQEGV